MPLCTPLPGTVSGDVAIGAGIALPAILTAAGLAATLPVRNQDTLVRQNILNISPITIILLAIGAFCGSIFLFVWYRH